jgi:hypothetical protein
VEVASLAKAPSCNINSERPVDSSYLWWGDRITSDENSAFPVVAASPTKDFIPFLPASFENTVIMRPLPLIRYFLFIVSTTWAIAVDAAAMDSCSKLSKASAFSLGIDVFSGKMISEDRAFAEVLRYTDPVRCFTKIMATGTNEAQMYALVALRELNRTQYTAAVKRLEQGSFTVITIATKEQGVLRREPSNTVLARIQRGEYQNIVEFWLKHDLPPKTGSEEMASKHLEMLKARLRRTRGTK